MADEKTIDILIEEIELSKQLLKLCLPFVKFHCERARFPEEPNKLKEAIEEFLEGH